MPRARPITARAEGYARAARVLALRASRYARGSAERNAIAGEAAFMRSRARDERALAEKAITREA